MRLGILGGTFDPPHNGHLMFADEALKQLNLDKVLFMLTPDPPHKAGNEITNMEIRYEMLNLAISNNDKFCLSDVEINRPGPHYSVDTMKILRRKYSEDKLIFLMGGDSLVDLPDTWHTPQDFVDACDGFGVFTRNGFSIDLDELEDNLMGIASKVQILEDVQIEVSSTQIRKFVSEGNPIDNLVPESVHKIIKNKNLYIQSR